MRNQLPKLKADMLLASGEGRVPFAAVFGRHPCHLVHTADVQDCRHCSLLLVLDHCAKRPELVFCVALRLLHQRVDRGASREESTAPLEAERLAGLELNVFPESLEWQEGLSPFMLWARC